MINTQKSLAFLYPNNEKVEKEEMKNPRVSRRKEIIKIRAKIKRNKGDDSKT